MEAIDLVKRDEVFYAMMGARIPYLPTAEQWEARYQPDIIARELFHRFTTFAEIIAGLPKSAAVSLQIFNLVGRSVREPRLDLCLFVRSAQPEEEVACREVRTIWSIIEHAFPQEYPFNYPLHLLHKAAISQRRADLSRPQQVVQLHKQLDRGPQQNLPSAFPHPYRQEPAPYALLPLLSALTGSSNRLGLVLSLQGCDLPDRLAAVRWLEEFSALAAGSEIYGRQQRSAAQRQDEQYAAGTPIFSQLADERIDRRGRSLEDERLHARTGLKVLESLLLNQGHLLDMRIALVSWSPSSSAGAVQAARSALSGRGIDTGSPPSINTPPREQTVYESDGARFDQLLSDLQILYHRPEADTFDRWRTVTLPEEAAALLTLPMPAEYGRVPGILARSEPFVLPLERDAERNIEQDGLVLGSILHRGGATNHVFHIPKSKLDQHILLAGRSGSGKTNSCLILLRELWRHGIPFLVLDPLDKSDYRLLLGDGHVGDEIDARHRPGGTKPLSDELRIYTLGVNASPFTFNPFRVPQGVTVQRHISQLLRCFLVAFAISDPVPALYRKALRELYTDCGWDLSREDAGGPNVEMPNFERFLQILAKVVEQRTADYGGDTRGNLRQATLLRMGSLLENNALLLNVTGKDEGLEPIITHPTIIELGHVGSDEDKSLIMAFLLTSLMPLIQRRPDRSRLHITLIEEAHRLMRRGGGGSGEYRGDATGQTSGDFSNLLAEVRGYKQGIIVADQSPSELVPAVFANTATHIMHQVRDPVSFEMMTSSFVLTPAQQSYARHLEVGHAISETARGSAVHIQPPNVSDPLRNALGDKQPGGITFFDSDEATGVVSDAAVQEIMEGRKAMLPMTLAVDDYEKLISRREQILPWPDVDGAIPKARRGVFCVGCKPLWDTGTCPYGEAVERLRGQPSYKLVAQAANDLQSNTNNRSWETIRDASQKATAAIKVNTKTENDVGYCLVAFVAQVSLTTRDSAAKKLIGPLRELIRDFHKNVSCSTEGTIHGEQ